MSRIGKKPIEIPSGVQVQINERMVRVKGPKGDLSLELHNRVSAAMADNKVQVSVIDPEMKSDKALWGLSARLIEGMVVGVTKGYEKKLEIQGIGYKAAVAGDSLDLNIGYTHQVKFKLPAGIKATVVKNIISISGIDKQQVGDIAAQIRSLKKPEPYKGKGMRYEGEIIKRKQGKKTA